jgi:hypothetical protein
LTSILLGELRRIGQVRWRCSPERGVEAGSSHGMNWIPVALLKPIPDGPELELGLTEDGQWVRPAAENSVIVASSPKSYLFFFTLLEMSHQQARETLEREFTTHGIDREWVRFFPFEQLVASALTSGSKFWPDSALPSLDTMEISDIIRDALDVLQKNGKTQQQRHAARRLLKKCRQSNAQSITPDSA